MASLFIFLSGFCLIYGICYLYLCRSPGSTSKKKTHLPPDSGSSRSIESQETDSEVVTPQRQLLEIHSVENYKIVYHQLHHIDDYPHILKSGERLLHSFMALTDKLAQNDTTNNSILHLKEYTESSLSKYMLDMETSAQDEFSTYCQRRKSGQPRHLFETRQDAAMWLKAISPIKLVDGAWLGNLRVATSPFALQPILRTAWQVLSEELGDGILAQNHVHVFENLIQSVIPNFPDASTKDFINSHSNKGNASAWRSALAQLTISLYPDKYVPEILGFNMNFELVTLETLKASRELKEVGLDPLYFLLHICIDNSDVGHTAMAVDTVTRYMRYIHSTGGEAIANKTWRRVQAGFALSQYIGQIKDEDAARSDLTSCPALLEPFEAQVTAIFKKKTQSARCMHCTSSIKFKGMSIEDWLVPERWEHPEWQTQFIDALGNSRPWIVRGNREHSRLMRELNWGGKMFGAFTAEECDIVGQWIDGMEPINHLDTATALTELSLTLSTTENPTSFSCKAPILERLLPLWFSSAGLLEGFCAVPAQTKNNFVMHILSVLRNQAGLGGTGYGKADDGKLMKGSSSSLCSIGQEMMHKAGFPVTKSVYNMLELWPVDFGWTMLSLARSARRNRDYLVGMALAFANLHEAMATSHLLSPSSQEALLAMARSELFHLEQCRLWLQSDDGSRSRFDRGYWLARGEIGRAFSSSVVETVTDP